MIGTTIGHYEIVTKIGEGGMGVVYLAHDTSLGRNVALKFLPDALKQDEIARKRFAREARSAAILDHPYICGIHEVGEVEGKSFIVMEYLLGQTLKDRMAQGTVPLKEAMQWAVEVVEALTVAHEKGIIHRDLKPANIMLLQTGHAKVMDFGLAKQMSTQLGSQEDTLTGALTREGTTVGTIPYMSPEQILGKDIDHRSDLFSLGVVLYEMLTGVNPFKRESGFNTAEAILRESEVPASSYRSDIPPLLATVVHKLLAKKPEERYRNARETMGDLQKAVDDTFGRQDVFKLRLFARWLRRPRIVIPAALVLVALSLLAFWLVKRSAKIRWAEENLLPQIEQFVMAERSGRDNLIDAYQLVLEAEKYIAGNSKLLELTSKCAVSISIETDPPGARISMKRYSAPDSEWEYFGISPLRNIRLPMGIFRWKMEKDGYEPVHAVASTYKADTSKQYFFVPCDISRVLDKKGSIPPGMVRVGGGQVEDIGYIDDFFIDQFEVTNRQFKEFVDQGGYQKKEYWKHPILKGGKVQPWEEARAEFIDQTGRPGPSTWQAGTFPQGQDDYPVSGVSWYEAAAFAEFAGKNLPTTTHWNIARGDLTPRPGFDSILYPLCNYKGEGPVPVGTCEGVTAYGAYDMAGNVREWCWNESPQGRVVRGGASSDINYMFDSLSQAPALDRSSKNGFRCAQYLDHNKIPEILLQPVQFGEVVDFYKLKLVSNAVFQVFKEQFSYDKKPLNAHVESTDSKARDWIKEKISFDAVNENERMTAYLFLPKHSRPPYQTVIYFPGSSAIAQISSQELEKYVWFQVDLSFLLQDGRAVLFPIYTGTFERSNKFPPDSSPDSRLYTEYYLQVVKEFKRSIDYLETRSDIDADRIAYLGFSWGGWLGAVIPAVEERLKVSIIKVGGLINFGRPEINPVNYVTRVKLPTLMFNGRYDMAFPYDFNVKPMYDLLGTPQEDKDLKLYDTDHFIPRKEFIKETLAWLDKYFGRQAR